jgi:tRNA(Ile)-lysidine synthase
MSLDQHFRQYIQSNNLFQQKDRLLLAVSGGLDSVVLCDLCHRSGYEFIMAHCNFQLRDEESNRDEQFVSDLGKKYGVGTIVKRFATAEFATLHKISIQVAARELRYQWFYELLADQSLHVACIVTGHHLDDNIETILMNFFKGTGIAGLRGIKPKHNNIVRPLLFARKEELEIFARQNQLVWVEDSSNLSDKYTRNYIRHQVIPLVQKIFPEAENNLAGNIQRFSDIEELYAQSIRVHLKKLMEVRGNEIHIPVLKLEKTAPLHTIVYEIVKNFGFHASQVSEIIELLGSETGKYVASSSYRVIKNRNWLIIAPLSAAEAGTILIEENNKVIEFSPDGNRNGSLRLDRVDAAGDASVPVPSRSLPADPAIASLDAKQIEFPLILRKWKKSDYFYPLGMKKKKKLARFFIDNKLSMTDKEKVWVLESNKKIIWVVGYRIDERFKVTDKTKSVLKISLIRT